MSVFEIGLGVGSVAPHQKLLKAEYVQQGHLPSQEGLCGFAFCSGVRRGGMCFSASFYCSNSENNKISSVKEKELG